MTKPSVVNTCSNIKEGVNIMDQHVKNRDFYLSRRVIDSVRTMTEQQLGPSVKRQTLDEFVADPLGDK